MTTKRNIFISLCLICILCFSFLIGMTSTLAIFVFHVDVQPKRTQKNYSRSITDEFTITAQELRLPSETELQELETLYNETLESFDDVQALSAQIRILYDEVLNAKVCSLTNRYFNLLENDFNLFQAQIFKIQKQVSLFEEKYTFCLDLISKIPEYSIVHDQKYDEFIEVFENKYEFILSQSKVYLQEKDEFLTFYLESQQLANSLFEEYFDLMCHIVYAESGICPDIEQCYVANVIENRIKDYNFPDNIYDVVYSLGQYSPVINGSINKIPSEETIQIVSDYLHGYIDTGMPDYVIFQARFPQGEYVWKQMPSGHYFCY